MQAGLAVIAEQGQLVFGILIAVALTASLAQRLLRISGAFDASLATGLSGWLVPFVVLSLLGIWLGLIPTLLLFTLGLFLTSRFQLQPQPVPLHEALSLLMLTLLSLLVRLAFIKDLLLPSYFDSAQHYLLIRNLVEPLANLPVGAAYYHQGFHWGVAWLVSLFGSQIGATMLVFGQVLLAFTPVGVYGFVRWATGSHAAGLLAFVLAGWGWYMPAHAANWGKYPAIASLSLLPFVVWLLYETTQTRRKALFIYSAVSVICVALLHSRSLIALGLLVVAWVCAQAWERLTLPWRVFVAGGVLSLLAWEMWTIQQQGILTLLLDPYVGDGRWVTVGALVLGLLAWRRHAGLTFTLLLGIVLWLGAVFVPVTVPGYGLLTLLDRPYVEMLLFLPLSIIGGLGLGELLKVLRQAWGGWSAGVLVTVLGVLVVGQAFESYNFRASACCILAERDDLAAITWLDERLPREAVVGVAASVMDVLPAETFEGYSGSDAGIWVLPLTGRRIVPVPNHADFTDERVLEDLCRAAVTHVYRGATGQTFNPDSLKNYPLVFAVGQAAVYELPPCP